MKIKKWTIYLFLLIIADSIFTIFVGRESNPIILWTMNTLHLSLVWSMVIRIFYCIPFLYILNKTNFSRITVFLYLGIYFLLSGVQFYVS